jgi:RHS repeat-associated protein
LRSWNWELHGGALPHSRAFDMHGRMVRHPLGGAVRDITYDAADRIANFTHLDAATGRATPATQALNQVFGYDETGRLTSVTTASASWGYAYDDNGNRTLMSLHSGNTALSRLHAVDPSSNRLLGMSSPTSTFSYDAAGNIINNLQGSFAWAATVDLSGRVSRLQASTAAGVFDVSYGHDNNGQRLWKRPAIAGPVADDLGPATASRQYCGTRTGALGLVTVYSTGSNTLPASGVVFVHDQQGHLLGEYDGASGAALREYIWLGDLPVAVVDGSATAPQIYYVQTDHLDTPRVLLDRAGRQRWSWVAEPFGNSAPVENPIGVGTVSLNLRMPGQYFDVESGLNYNWHRSYDAGVGRYTQSDPIGLEGGINTYIYVGGNPVSKVDPMGLATCIYSVSTGRMDCMRNGSERFTWSGTFASGNNKEAGCKNNSSCETKEGIGPIPRGCWAWSGPGSSGKPKGRALTPLPPLQSRPFNRDLFRTHSCDNPFGPSLGPEFCSEGCVTGTRGTVGHLNDLIDAEPSVLCVVD